jgi:azurin
MRITGNSARNRAVLAVVGVAAVTLSVLVFVEGRGGEDPSNGDASRRDGDRSRVEASRMTPAPATEPRSLPTTEGSPADPAPLAPPAEEKTLRIKGVTGLQYDKVRFTVRPRQQVRVIFRNESNVNHNLVFTTPGDRVKIVKAALQMGSRGPAKDHVPDTDRVLAHAPVLKPGGFHEFTFTAPAEEGAYPYVCTYPGHGYVMYGVMRVTNDPGGIPPLSEDPLVPPDSLRGRVEGREATTLHPYSTKPPIIYRTFMPESGPASIAVGLTGGVSYAFDAGRSMVRYAWSGGFIDNSEIWKGHVRNQRAEIVGTVFFRSEGEFPLRIGSPDGEPPAPSFQGYRLVEGRPEFTYEVEGATVRQRIRPAEGDAPGLVRDFSISGVQGRPVRFVTSRSDSVAHRASAGAWRGDTLRLDPADARAFTITTVRAEGKRGKRSPVGQRASMNP